VFQESVEALKWQRLTHHPVHTFVASYYIVVTHGLMLFMQRPL